MSQAPSIPESVKESLAHSKAEYVHLGKSGLRVSIPILGAMSIGHQDWAPWVIEEEKVCSVFGFLYCRLLTADCSHFLS